MAKDPVCGMEVKPDQAAGKSDYSGQTYYFCSNGCKQRFDQNPQVYAPKQPAQQNQRR
jgi:P-type Cu+ transporter